ncbi:hypothetical protein Tco_0733416, partial [Tanacetum coccineum]
NITTSLALVQDPVIAFTGNEDARKFFMERELTSKNIKSFGEDFLQDNLIKPFFKSDLIPETNDGDLKIVVGNNKVDRYLFLTVKGCSFGDLTVKVVRCRYRPPQKPARKPFTSSSEQHASAFCKQFLAF